MPGCGHHLRRHQLILIEDLQNHLVKRESQTVRQGYQIARNASPGGLFVVASASGRKNL